MTYKIRKINSTRPISLSPRIHSIVWNQTFYKAMKRCPLSTYNVSFQPGESHSTQLQENSKPVLRTQILLFVKNTSYPVQETRKLIHSHSNNQLGRYLRIFHCNTRRKNRISWVTYVHEDNSKHPHISTIIRPNRLQIRDNFIKSPTKLLSIPCECYPTTYRGNLSFVTWLYNYLHYTKVFKKVLSTILNMSTYLQPS